MKKLSIAFLLVLLLSLALAIPAFAKPPSPASGTVVLIDASPDGTVLTFQITGTIDGIFVIAEGPGRADQGVFTGTIGGGDPGTIVFNSLNPIEKNPGHGTTLQGSGTGGLVGAHAVVTYTFDETGLGTYTGHYHYDSRK